MQDTLDQLNKYDHHDLKKPLKVSETLCFLFFKENPTFMIYLKFSFNFYQLIVLNNYKTQCVSDSGTILLVLASQMNSGVGLLIADVVNNGQTFNVKVITALRLEINFQ